VSFESHLAQVEPLLRRYGYLAVFASIFVEGFGIPAPGQTLLVAGAVLAARGELSLGLLLASATLAAGSGTLVGWTIGWYGGRRLLARIATGKRLARVGQLFERWGRGFVLFGRFVDGIRQLNGIAAGALDMPLPRFLLWSGLGAVLWTTFWGLGAYWLGRDFAEISHLVHRARPAALIAVAVVVSLVVAWIVRETR
jgi:membrane protein DedA with SNARE-associated domain